MCRDTRFLKWMIRKFVSNHKYNNGNYNEQYILYGALIRSHCERKSGKVVYTQSDTQMAIRNELLMSVLVLKPKPSYRRYQRRNNVNWFLKWKQFVVPERHDKTSRKTSNQDHRVFSTEFMNKTVIRINEKFLSWIISKERRKWAPVYVRNRDDEWSGMFGLMLFII